MNEWNIQARAHACQACQRPFEDQRPYHTLLSEEKQQFQRLDICDPCWRDQYSQGAGDRKGFISYWHGTYEAPPATAPDPIQKENAETLLRKLIQHNDPRHAPAAYILAVILERKRLLKIKEQIIRDGHRTFLYEQPRTGDLFTIPDPNLQLNQLEQVQKDVAHLLEHPDQIGNPANPTAPAQPPDQLGAQPLSEPIPVGRGAPAELLAEPCETTHHAPHTTPLKSEI